MDPSYDSQLAAERVQDYIMMRNAQSPGSGPQQITQMKLEEYTLAAFKNPKGWRVVRKGDNKSDEKAEAMFRIQGVLCHYDLPPVSPERLMRHDGKRKSNTIQHIHLHQSMTITGFGCTGFEQATWKIIDTGYEIEKAFSTALLQWKVGMYEGHNALSFNARYFTLRRDAPTERGLEFGDGVDPKGLLKGLLLQNMVHTIDNKVMYSKRVEEKGQVTYVLIEPKTFQAGDIVEVCFDFYCAPAKGNKVVFTPHLRGLTLLDDTLRTKKAKGAEMSLTESKPFTLKRMAWDMLGGEVNDMEQSLKKMAM